MQGLGQIIRANAAAGGWTPKPHVRSQTQNPPNRGKYGSVGADGEGTPWLVERRANNVIAPFAVKRIADNIIVGEHAKLNQARKQIARLIQETP